MVHSHHFLVACSVLDHEIFQCGVVASFTASTPNPRSCFTTSFFCLFVLINEFAYWKCSQAFSCSEKMNIPTILSHDSTWAFVECSTCWVIVEFIWTPRSITPQQTLNMLRACTVDKSSAFARGLKCTLIHIILPLSDQAGCMSSQTLFLAWHTVWQAYRKKYLQACIVDFNGKMVPTTQSVSMLSQIHPQ